MGCNSDFSFLVNPIHGAWIMADSVEDMGTTILMDGDGWCRVTLDYSTYFKQPYSLIIREEHLEDVRRQLNEWHLNKEEDK